MSSVTLTDAFLDVSLPVKGHIDVRDSLASITQPEILDNENRKQMKDGRLHKCSSTIRLLMCPKLLLIQLNRFENVDGQGVVKINAELAFPDALDLAPYAVDQEDQEQSFDYVLCGIMMHSGGAVTGHYYYYMLSMEDKQTNNTWTKINDDLIVSVSEDAVQEAAFGRVARTSAYMLLYAQKRAIDGLFLPVPDDAARGYSPAGRLADHSSARPRSRLNTVCLPPRTHRRFL
jgi:ubiquitin C-terminal hydrolase